MNNAMFYSAITRSNHLYEFLSWCLIPRLTASLPRNSYRIRSERLSSIELIHILGSVYHWFHSDTYRMSLYHWILGRLPLISGLMAWYTDPLYPYYICNSSCIPYTWQAVFIHDSNSHGEYEKWVWINMGPSHSGRGKMIPILSRHDVCYPW